MFPPSDPHIRPAGSEQGREEEATAGGARHRCERSAGKDAGLKLMEIKRLREKCHRITLLGEKRFWKLVTRS
jgi:hypothetical protein